MDVQGTVRTMGFTMSGQTPISGYVLTASDGVGDTTWASGGAVSGWTVSGANVYESLGGNVGIGTFAPKGSLVVTNGNVGIGTFAPDYLFQVGSDFNGGGVAMDNNGDILFDNAQAQINATKISLVSNGFVVVTNGISGGNGGEVDLARQNSSCLIQHQVMSASVPSIRQTK